jgi:hypothetical protein
MSLPYLVHKADGVKVVPILIAEANESECCVPDPILAGEA